MPFVDNEVDRHNRNTDYVDTEGTLRENLAKYANINCLVINVEDTRSSRSCTLKAVYYDSLKYIHTNKL